MCVFIIALMVTNTVTAFIFVCNSLGQRFLQVGYSEELFTDADGGSNVGFKKGNLQFKNLAVTCGAWRAYVQICE